MMRPICMLPWKNSNRTNQQQIINLESGLHEVIDMMADQWGLFATTLELTHIKFGDTATRFLLVHCVNPLLAGCGATRVSVWA